MNARINERTFLQVETNSLYLKEEFGDMSFWPNESGRFNVLHLDDGHPLQVIITTIINNNYYKGKILKATVKEAIHRQLFVNKMLCEIIIISHFNVSKY